MKKFSKLPLVCLVFASPFNIASAQISDGMLIVHAQESVKKIMKDPQSTKFGKIYVVENIVCGEVNSKNSFGGYTGFKKFISAGTPNSTFFESHMAPGEFEAVWKIKC